MIYHVYVGSYMDDEGGDGIYLFELDTEKNSLELVASYPGESENPSFLAVTRKHVFAVSECSGYGFLTAWKRDPDTGRLTMLNRLKTEGSAMCHVTVWPDGRHLSAANYMSGSLLVCQIDPHGYLTNVCDFKQHEGVGYESVVRQEGPHVHATGVSPDGQYLYASDLGLDQVFCYKIGDQGSLRLAKESMQIRTPKGMGPRHFAFRKDGTCFYLVTEMGNRLLVYEKMDGRYRLVQDVTTLPEEYRGPNLGADIHLSKDERFLYTSNRGADTIAAFRIEESGRVIPAGQYGCQGKIPRNFCITGNDRLFLIANQKSGNVVLCKRNPQTGEVGEKLAEVSVPHAVYVSAIMKEGVSDGE